MRFQRFWYESAVSLVLGGSALLACSAEPPEVPEDDTRAGRGGTGMVMAGTGGTNTPGTGGSAPGTGGTSSPGTGGTNAPGTGGTAPGTGGTGGTGGTTSPGTGGSGGMAVHCGMPAGVATVKVIDDLEDGDNTIGNGVGQPVPPARVGYWFTYNEGLSCSQYPAPDADGLLPFPPSPTPGNGSLFGAMTSGTGCTADWGAGIGVDFNNCGMASTAYDGSAYTGISFWYKSETPIRVLVGTKPNLPSAEGGTCTSECYNHHGKNFATSTAGTTATITWAELGGTSQIGSPPADPQTYGTKRGFNPAQLLNLQVQVDQAGGANFEIWLDDLSFL